MRGLSHSKPSKKAQAEGKVARKLPSGAGGTAGADAGGSEWTTEAWKHRVEAEARHNLEKKIHGVGRSRA